LAQQAEDRLRQLVGLGQHRSTSLLHDLVLGQVGRLGCVVGIQYAAAGSGGVLSNVLQVADGRLEAVLHCTQLGTLAVDLLHGTVQNLNGLLRALSGGDVQVSYAGILNYGSVCSGIGSLNTQHGQASTRRTISNTEVILREQTQLTVIIGRSHTGTGSVDCGHNGFHITTLGQFDFGTVQGDGSILGQLGLRSTSSQAQLLQQTLITTRISQFYGSAIFGGQSDATIGLRSFYRT